MRPLDAGVYDHPPVPPSGHEASCNVSLARTDRGPHDLAQCSEQGFVC